MPNSPKPLIATVRITFWKLQIKAIFFFNFFLFSWPSAPKECLRFAIFNSTKHLQIEHFWNRIVQKSLWQECSVEQLCTDNIPMGLSESDNSSMSDSFEESLFNTTVIAVKFPNFYNTFLFSWLSFILQPTITSPLIKCIFIYSSLFLFFWTGPS